jgi:hypothetical protein
MIASLIATLSQSMCGFGSTFVIAAITPHLEQA